MSKNSFKQQDDNLLEITCINTHSTSSWQNKMF